MERATRWVALLTPMRILLNRLYAASALSGALALVLICLIISVQVVFNLIDKVMLAVTGEAIGLTVPSYSEFSGLFLAAGTFLALGYTFRESAHIRVTLLLQFVNPSCRRVFERCSLGIGVAMVLFMTWYLGFITWEAWVYQDVTSGIIPVPIWIPQLCMTIGSGILGVAMIDGGLSNSGQANDD